MTRWNLSIQDETDRKVRVYLARKGLKKGDLSSFVEDCRARGSSSANGPRGPRPERGTQRPGGDGPRERSRGLGACESFLTRTSL